MNFFSFKGQLIGVIGKVGSGKSSLLAAITAEMEKRLGEVFGVFLWLELALSLICCVFYIQFMVVCSNAVSSTVC